MKGRGLIPTGGNVFTLLHVVQTGSGAQQVSYPVGTGSWAVKRHGTVFNEAQGQRHFYITLFDDPLLILQ
jgi:hypothetical protein